MKCFSRIFLLSYLVKAVEVVHEFIARLAGGSLCAYSFEAINENFSKSQSLIPCDCDVIPDVREKNRARK